jgi:predicted transcriptional regulator
MDDETLKKFAYVNISTYRVRAVKALKDEDKIPSQIAQDAGIRMNHFSNVLRQLKNYEVAECINEESKRNRIYRLTSAGKEIAEYLENSSD